MNTPSKTLTLFLIGYLSCASISSQTLQVDAGADTILCIDDAGFADSINLEAYVIGGQAAYTYLWTLNNGDSASQWLHDVKSNSPLLLNLDIYDSSKTFYVHVTDDSGSIAMDSITVTVCGYYPVPLGYTAISPTVGDTVRFDFSSSFSCAIDSIRWQPASNIISPLDTWYIEAIVDDLSFSHTDFISTIYHQFGCEAVINYVNPQIDQVYPLGLTEVNKAAVQIFPNPATTSIVIESNSPLESVQILNLSGQIVHLHDTRASRTEIQLEGLASGLYVVETTSLGETNRQRLIVQ